MVLFKALFPNRRTKGLGSSLHIKQGRKRPLIWIKRVTFRERERESESFGILYTGYPLSILKIINGLPIIHSKDYTGVTLYP